MIVTFCGHADFVRTDACERRLLTLLEQVIGDASAECYLGGYGNFDRFAYTCCRKFKKTHPRTLLIYVTPYLDRETPEGYDGSLYAARENIPLKFAITSCNRAMAIAADCVIAYIDRTYGGAYEMYAYARRRGKRIFNLAEASEKEVP